MSRRWPQSVLVVGACAWMSACAGAGAGASESGRAGFDPGYLQGLGDVRYHRVHSATLDQTYHLFVRLPEEYAGSSEQFATAYLLDGGTTFPMLAGFYHYLRFAEAVPPMILVGISYGPTPTSRATCAAAISLRRRPSALTGAALRAFRTFCAPLRSL